MLYEESFEESEYKVKEELYNFYYELSSEIQNKKIEIEEDAYNEKIKSSTISQINNYIKEAIRVLYTKAIPQRSEAVKPSNSELNIYEQQLRYYENKQRQSIKNEFQNKLLKEALEYKLEDYNELENEFEEMKTKYRYEEGKFLDNERKENEIGILKRENTILKKEILSKEMMIKELTNKIAFQNQTIQQFKQKILTFEKERIQKKEDIQAIMKNFGGISFRPEFQTPMNINICNSNNSKVDTNYITKSGTTSPHHILNLKKEIELGMKNNIRYINTKRIN